MKDREFEGEMLTFLERNKGKIMKSFIRLGSIGTDYKQQSASPITSLLPIHFFSISFCFSVFFPWDEHGNNFLVALQTCTSLFKKP